MIWNKPYNKRLMRKAKMDLIDRAVRRYGVNSFADLGGVWRVEGGYSFYAASEHGAQVRLVDTHPTDTVRSLTKKWPRVSLVEGSFGDPAIVDRVRGVDAVIFYDVLLHQVSPDWNEVLNMYSWARVLVIYNQQWTGPETVRLLDLGREAYFENVPAHEHDEASSVYGPLFERLDQPHPDYKDGRKWRDVHHIWQWGITDLDMITRLAGLGYKLEFFENHGRFGKLPRFENHAMIFVKA